MTPQLISSRHNLFMGEPIFALNAEANARKAQGESIINASIGMLLDDNGAVVVLDTVLELWRQLEPLEIAPYAAIDGERQYLDALIGRYWPNLDRGVSCATPGGTAALSVSVCNFLEPGQTLLTFSPAWGWYALIAEEHGVRLSMTALPTACRNWDPWEFHRAARNLLRAQGRLLVWLNDPCHNPSGTSLSRVNRIALLECLRELAQHGPVTLVLDPAYAEYSAEPGEVSDALADYAEFAREARDSRLLVGAALSISKSLTLYGARCGGLVFPWSTDSSLQAALSKTCCALFANAPRAPQSLVVRLSRDREAQQRLDQEHRYWSAELKLRASALDHALKAAGLPGIRWQGGFFTTIHVTGSAEVARRLKNWGVFVLPIQEGLRVGLCGLRAADATRFANALRRSVQ